MPGNKMVNCDTAHLASLRVFAIRQGKLQAGLEFIKNRTNYIGLLRSHLVAVQMIYDRLELASDTTIAETLPEMPEYTITLPQQLAPTYAAAAFNHPTNRHYTHAELLTESERLRNELQATGEQIALQTATIDDLANQIDALQNAYMMKVAIVAERLARWSMETSLLATTLTQFSSTESAPTVELGYDDFTPRFLI